MHKNIHVPTSSFQMAATNDVSAKYTCDRCHYETQRLSSYVAHLKRQKSCPATYSSASTEELLNRVEDNRKTKQSCPTCGQIYENRQHKYRHQLICLARNVRSTTTNNITYNINTTINNNRIIVNPFENPAWEHVRSDPDTWRQIVNNLLRDCELGVLQLQCLKYFDVDHPENHSLKIPELDTCSVWDGEIWIPKDIGYLCRQFVGGFKDDIRDAILSGVAENDEEFRDRLRKFVKQFGFAFDMDFSDIDPLCVDQPNVLPDVYEKRRLRVRQMFFSLTKSKMHEGYLRLVSRVSRLSS